MLAELQKVDKKGLFQRTETSISYATGFPTIDYRNGYKLKSYDERTNEYIGETESIGIVSGSFNTVIGRSATAKTTGVIQMAYNIIKPFEDGLIYQSDLENSTTYTRVRNVTQMSTDEMSKKFVLKSDSVFIEDIFETIMSIYTLKINDPKRYQYDTGILDEFGNPIKQYVPTVIIIDSIPSIALRVAEDKVDMQTETYATRKAKSIAQFYRNLGPYIKKANIIVFAINHINDKIDINPFAKTQAQTMYLKMDEHLPGGSSPIYYANNIFKFISNTKYSEEKEGFDGFRIKCELIKSRTNKAGQFANLIYDQEHGFSYARTMLEFIDEISMLGGRNPHRFIKGYDHLKFSTKKFPEALSEKPELHEAMMDVALPVLRSFLSSGEDRPSKVDEFQIMNNVLESINADEEYVPIDDKRNEST